MRTLVHLSDLHFGRVDETVLDPLVETVAAAAPDVVVVSGDLTQRARSAQFAQARAFLARLPGPQVVVPGNHDVPLWNVYDRLLRPLRKYKRHIGDDLCPSFVDGEIAVLGVNTARSLVIKNGRVNRHQVQALRDVLGRLDAGVVKVVVTHHPFDVAPDVHHRERVGRADMALRTFARCGVDVLLAGHLHSSRTGIAGHGEAFAGQEALAVSAGTATSVRRRGEANSFNLLRLDKRRVEVERHDWNDEARRFLPAALEVYERDGAGWKPVPPMVPTEPVPTRPAAGGA